MKLLVLGLFAFLLSCKPEQAPVDFGLTIKPLAGKDAALSTEEDRPVKFSYKIEENEESIDLKVAIFAKPGNGRLENCEYKTNLELECDYIPNQDFFGIDRIQFKSQDGDFASDESSTMLITVTPVPDKPVRATDGFEKLPENSTFDFRVKAARDVDSSESVLKYEVVSGPTNGTLSNCLDQNNDRTCTYEPANDFYGEDSFTYKVIDETGLESEEITEVKLKVLNYPEIAAAVELSVDEYSSVTFNVESALDHDNAANEILYKIIATPKNGRLSNCFNQRGNTACTYTPNPGFFGKDNFEYIAVDSDGLESKNSVIFGFDVKNINLAPAVGADQNLSLKQDQKLTFQVNMATDRDSTAFQYNIVTRPMNGSLINCFQGVGNRTCTYVPLDVFNGKDSFTYNVTDETGVTSPMVATVNFNVIRAYLRPSVGADQTIASVQGYTKKFKASDAIDKDSPQSEIMYMVVSNPKNGVLVNCFESRGSSVCNYKPNTKFYGSDSFTYKVVDEQNMVSDSTATIKFDIKPRQAPVPGNITIVNTLQFSEKAFVVNAATDADSEADQLKYEVVTAPKGGVLTSCFSERGNLNCKYKPNADYSGEDSFTYRIVDEFDIASKTNGEVKIYIDPRLKPIAGAKDNFDTPIYTWVDLNVTPAKDLDTPANLLKYELVAAPKNGIVTNCFLSKGQTSCRYRPNQGFMGLETLQYHVVDEYGLKSDEMGTINIEVTPRQAPNVGSPVVANTKQKIAVEVEVSEAKDGDTPVEKLQYVIVEQPKNGTLSGCFLLPGNRKCTYAPSPSFYGEDSFKYKVVDDYGNESVELGLLTIKVEQVNTKPIIGANQSFNLPQDSIKVIQLNEAKDLDNPSPKLIYFLKSYPKNGILTNCIELAGGTEIQNKRDCTYTPNPGFYGTDSFEYYVKDEAGTRSDNSATVNFNVIRVNAKPRVGDNQYFQVAQSKSLSFTVSLASSSQTPAAQLKYEVVVAPTNGTLSACFLAPGNRDCTYTPTGKYYGADFFTYKVIDTVTGEESEVNAKVDLEIIPRVAPKPAPYQLVKLKQYEYKEFNVTPATDPDSSPAQLKYDVVDQPKNGTLTNCFLAPGFVACRYTPNPNFYGTDRLTYSVTDDYGFKSETNGVIEFVVERVYIKPEVGADQTENTDQDKAVSFTVNKATDKDSDDATLVYKVVTQPKNGTLSGCFTKAGDMKCTYTPNQYFYGADYFTYHVIDETGYTSSRAARVNILVKQINAPPMVGANQTFNLIQGNSKAFSVNEGSDRDSSLAQLTYKVKTQPKNGTLTGCFNGKAVRTCTYTPNKGFYGTDSFTYEVWDNFNTPSISAATVNFNIQKQLAKPVVGANQQFALQEGSTVSFEVSMAFDADSLASELNYVITKQPSYGTLSNCLTDFGIRSCTYTPKPTFNGTDNLQYRVVDKDGLQSTSSATVTFEVAGKIYSGEESFQQNAMIKTEKVDITWVIDNSGSMGNDQATLRANTQSFIDKFLVNGKARYPFRMAVTTTEADRKSEKYRRDPASGTMYDLSSSLAESDFAKFKKNFEDAVLIGTGGSGSEKAMASAAACTSALSTWHGGNDTLQIFIILSDEREQSTSKTAAGWANYFQGMKDNPGKVRIYPIIDSDSGNRYRDLAAITGGSVYSIRNSFDGILDNIGSAVTNLLNAYLLDGRRRIIENTIKVYINNQLEDPSTYTYGANAITFKTPPAQNATIRVTYDYYNRYTGN